MFNRKGGGKSFQPISLIAGAFHNFANDATKYTATASPIGTANTNRWVTVTIGGATTTSGRFVSSVTIGGVSATIRTTVSTASAGVVMAVAFAQVPAGTTANIVVTFNGSMMSCGMRSAVFLAQGLQMMASNSLNHSAVANVTLSDVACAKYGLVLGSRGQYLGGISCTHSWNGVDSTVLLSDIDFGDSGSRRLTLARVNTTEDSTIRDYNMTWNGTPGLGGGVLVVSFRQT